MSIALNHQPPILELDGSSIHKIEFADGDMQLHYLSGALRCVERRCADVLDSLQERADKSWEWCVTAFGAEAASPVRLRAPPTVLDDGTVLFEKSIVEITFASDGSTSVQLKPET